MPAAARGPRLVRGRVGSALECVLHVQGGGSAPPSRARSRPPPCKAPAAGACFLPRTCRPSSAAAPGPPCTPTRRSASTGSPSSATRPRCSRRGLRVYPALSPTTWVRARRGAREDRSGRPQPPRPAPRSGRQGSWPGAGSSATASFFLTSSHLFLRGGGTARPRYAVSGVGLSDNMFPNFSDLCSPEANQPRF